MQTPIVTEISALSAHRREVELVRLSLMAVPERAGRGGHHGNSGDPLRAMTAARVSPAAGAAKPRPE